MILNTDLSGTPDPELLLERLREAQQALLRAYAQLEVALDGAQAPEALMRGALDVQACHLLAGGAVNDIMSLAHHRQRLLGRSHPGGRASLFVQERH